MGKLVFFSCLLPHHLLVFTGKCTYPCTSSTLTSIQPGATLDGGQHGNEWAVSICLTAFPQCTDTYAYTLSSLCVVARGIKMPLLERPPMRSALCAVQKGVCVCVCVCVHVWTSAIRDQPWETRPPGRIFAGYVDQQAVNRNSKGALTRGAFFHATRILGTYTTNKVLVLVGILHVQYLLVSRQATDAIPSHTPYLGTKRRIRARVATN